MSNNENNINNFIDLCKELTTDIELLEILKVGFTKRCLHKDHDAFISSEDLKEKLSKKISKYTNNKNKTFLSGKTSNPSKTVTLSRKVCKWNLGWVRVLDDF